MTNGPEAVRPALHGTEGDLVLIRITVEPRRLEEALGVLADLEFPINPQLYHDAAIVFLQADGSKLAQPASVIEFPAWEGRVQMVREALRGGRFEDSCVTVKDLLEAIRRHEDQEPAPPGAPYKSIIWHRPLGATA